MGGPNWGKDFGRDGPQVGAAATNRRCHRSGRTAAAAATAWAFPSISGRRVVVKCYADGRLQRPAADPAVVLDAHAAAQELRPAGGRPTTGGCGCCSAIIRCPAAARETWAEYAMSYDGKAWGKPRMLADSDNLLDNRPAVVPFGADGVMAVYQQRLAAARRQQRGGARPAGR